MPLKKEKTHFTVRLTELKATDKVKLIKEVKNFVPGVNLVQVRRGLWCPGAGGWIPGPGRTVPVQGSGQGWGRSWLHPCIWRI